MRFCAGDRIYYYRNHASYLPSMVASPECYWDFLCFLFLLTTPTTNGEDKCWIPLCSVSWGYSEKGSKAVPLLAEAYSCCPQMLLTFLDINFLTCEVGIVHSFWLLWGWNYFIHIHTYYFVCVHTHIHACLGQKHFWISSDTLPMPHFIKSRRTEGNIIIPFKTHIHSPQPTRLRTNPVQYSRPSWVRSRIHFSATFPMMLHLSWVTEHDLPLLTFMLFSYLSLYLHQFL